MSEAPQPLSDPVFPITEEEIEAILVLASWITQGKSRSYVEDALQLARFALQALPQLRTTKQLFDNLTATQNRCTALLNELRRTRLEHAEKVCDLEARITELEE